MVNYLKVESKLEMEGDWKNIPTWMLKKIDDLMQLWKVKEVKSGDKIRAYKGMNEFLSQFGFDVAEKIPNSKRFFKRIEQFDTDYSGTCKSDLLNG